MKIPIKKFVDDETLSYQERFERLLKHHEEETKWMYNKLKEYKKKYSNLLKILELKCEDEFDLAEHLTSDIDLD